MELPSNNTKSFRFFMLSYHTLLKICVVNIKCVLHAVCHMLSCFTCDQFMEHFCRGEKRWTVLNNKINKLKLCFCYLLVILCCIICTYLCSQCLSVDLCMYSSALPTLYWCLLVFSSNLHHMFQLSQVSFMKQLTK